jgi:FAD/FMN-containing dehydrogenase
MRPDNLKACALVRPAGTGEVARVLRYCHDQGVAVVTQGGLTGLVRGADAGAADVILSLERMRNIENIDPVQRVATVQAGVTLQSLQEAADAQGLFFPLDLAARGSATLGGNAATNAGGNRVIRFGMMRDMVLGLEAVLADGTVVSSMNQLLKNNTGYDLKQLLVGSEGTLGVITRMVLRLRERPLRQDVAIVAVASFEALAALLRHMDRHLGGTLSAFEAMWQSYYQLVTSAPAKGQAPLSRDYPFYVLIESLGSNPAVDKERFSAALESALESRLIVDAAVAQSARECLAFWGLREDVEQVGREGPPVLFDVSAPLAQMGPYIDGVRTALTREIGPHHLWVFGHLGDGNLHVIVSCKGMDPAAQARIAKIVYDPLSAFGGSVSAEHGIGLDKKGHLPLSRNAAEIAMMRRLKQALDPRNILNPGKIFDAGA